MLQVGPLATNISDKHNLFKKFKRKKKKLLLKSGPYSNEMEEKQNKTKFPEIKNEDSSQLNKYPQPPTPPSLPF